MTQWDNCNVDPQQPEGKVQSSEGQVQHAQKGKQITQLNGGYVRILPPLLPPAAAWALLVLTMLLHSC
jgi:hypothetical protein